jgi:hypothetical protein
VDPFAAKQVLRPPFDTRQYRRLLRRSYCHPVRCGFFDSYSGTPLDGVRAVLGVLEKHRGLMAQRQKSGCVLLPGGVF